MGELRVLVKQKCFAWKCAIKNTCLRYVTKSNSREQEYLAPRYDKDGKCLDEWKLTRLQEQELNKK